MATTEFKAALIQVATERGISAEDVIESIKSALISAYKKDYGADLTEEQIEEITVIVDPDTGEAKIIKDKKDVTPPGFGRIAAQTAKQVILQKIRESEKKVLFDEFKDKIGILITGQIFRIENGLIILDIGKAQGVLPQSEQVENEHYRINQRLKVYVKDVRTGPRGTEVILSRSDAELVRRLFEQEVPEVSSGVVEIKAIAREAGSRTKIAVSSNDAKIDPVGSCVGQKGVRVQAIISELFGEKIDIIPFSASIEKYIAAALSPARVTGVEIIEDENRAVVSVPEDQQSLAIGREGQNARLANKLTKWKIDIKGTKGVFDTTEDTSSQSTENRDVVGVWDAAIEKVNKQLEDSAKTTEEKIQENTESEKTESTQ